MKKRIALALLYGAFWPLDRMLERIYLQIEKWEGRP